MRRAEALRDVAVAADPVAAVLEAHRDGAAISLRTSGTTGTRRSVVRTTDSWVASFPTVTALLGMEPSARVWIPGPLTSTMNLFAAVHARHAGAERVTGAGAATHAHLTPAALARLLGDRDDRRDHSDLGGVHVLVAGDRLPPALAARAEAAGARVSHYYGAAELSFVAWGAHEEDLRPFPGVRVAVREQTIWVRSPFVCEGYAASAGPLRRDGGWSTVEDRGALVNGYLRVAGRGTDTIVTAGATVLAADVEAVLRPAAYGEVVAVGVAHPDLGQVLVGVLSEADDLEAVRARARQALDASYRPRRWFHSPDLPLTASGKVDRSALSAMLGTPAADAARLV